MKKVYVNYVVDPNSKRKWLGRWKEFMWGGATRMGGFEQTRSDGGSSAMAIPLGECSQREQGI